VTCSMYGGWGETLVPPYTCGNVPLSLSRGPGRKPSASSYMRKRPSLSLRKVALFSADRILSREPPAAAALQGPTPRTSSLNVCSYGLGFMQTLLIIPKP